MIKTCKRCKEEFIPVYLDLLKKYSNCCEDCGMRNILDALDLPTPPSMLDAYTKIPTLTKEEFNSKLKKASEEQKDWIDDNLTNGNQEEN